MKKSILTCTLLLTSFLGFTQGSTDYGGGLKFNLNPLFVSIFGSTPSCKQSCNASFGVIVLPIAFCPLSSKVNNNIFFL